MLNTAHALFEDYNRVISENHENIIAKLLSNLSPNEIEDNYEDIYNQAIVMATSWDNTANDVLDGLTPTRFFSEINDFEVCLSMYKLGVQAIDDVFPASFMELLYRFKDNLIPVFMEYTSESVRLDDKSTLCEAVASLKLLGEWQVTSAIHPIISALLQHKAMDEFYYESLWEALYLIGLPSVKKIIEALNSSDIIYLGHEYLLIALTELGKSFPSDSIYSCIKNTFLKMENKIYGAICLGQYGNPRAIPFLRGYYLKNSEALSDEVKQEIKSSIQRLGGQTGDLV